MACADAQRRSAAFGRAFQAHLTKLLAEPGVYGDLGLYEVFEMREECLREFGFADAYRRALSCCLAWHLVGAQQALMINACQ